WAAARTRGVAAGRSAQRACERSSDWRRGAAGSPDPELVTSAGSPDLDALPCARTSSPGRRYGKSMMARRDQPGGRPMKAAMFHGAHEPLTTEDVEIDKPIDHEVLVRVVASGVCHSDLHFVDGFYDFPAPAILGHEAAGIVEDIGPLVDDFAPGDHVIACLSVFCGRCEYCLTGRTH